MSAAGLVADIGGTHVRLALTHPDTRNVAIESVRTYPTHQHRDIAAAARAYLDEVRYTAPLAGLVFGVAGPVNNGTVRLTNAGWTIAEADLRSKLNVSLCRVINDFEALAHAVPVLSAADLRQIGRVSFTAPENGTVALAGPGTGFGVGGLLCHDRESTPLVTEGGHAAFAPTDDTEIEILRILTREFGRVSNERILSGPGLMLLYRTLAIIEGRATPDATPETITQTARNDATSFEAKVFARFCAILGSVAGDVALVMGARHGVLLAGGILPDMADIFAASGFRDRFESKGRFTEYMKLIPTSLIVQPHAGLLGAAAALRSLFRKARHVAG